MLVLIIFIWVLNSIGSIATPVSKINPSPHREQVSSVFDVPSLLGKNINQIRTALGTPTYDKEPTKLQLSLGVTEWDKSWEREGADLLVTYNIKTKKVIDFFIGGVDPSGSTNDKKLLLDVAGLKEGDPKYKLEFVEVRVPKPEPGFYTGVKVMPQ
ncbi:MAG: hypothetical protein PHI06_12490 [Desulfobulbaceae bacterium]|nr:hypothetical protein [Desulfobulbaceae bacterium]